MPKAVSTPLEDARVVPPWWSELFQRSPRASIFTSPAWIQTWLDVFGAEFCGEWVRFEAAGQTIGGCLVLERRVHWQMLPIGSIFLNVGAETSGRSPLTEYNQALCLAGQEEVLGRAVADHFNGRRWSRAGLWGYEEGPFSRAFLAQLSQCALETRSALARYVDLTGLSKCTYESTLSSKTRSQIRRCRRMYEEAHGSVLAECASSAEEAIAWLDEMARLHNAIWTSRGRSGAFENEEYVAFHHRLIRRLWDDRAVDVFRVHANGRPIGYTYNFLNAGKVACFQSGFVQEEDPHLKPGLLTHALAIAHYAERGCLEYDLLSGDSRYKRSLTKATRPLYWTAAYRASLYGRALSRLREVQKRIVARREAAAAGGGDETTSIQEAQEESA